MTKYKHSLGQNFITDDALFARLAGLSPAGENDTVLEIGTGEGGLTKALAAKCGQVITVEIDDALIPILRVTLEKYRNVRLIHGDIMRLNIGEITGGSPFHVAANIPYYLTGDLLEMLLTGPYPVRSVSVMLQKEAAQKLVALPGEDAYCPLSLYAQYHWKPEIALEVPACMFTPPPKVDSAFAVLEKREAPLYPVSDEKRLRRIIRAAFAMRRKTLVNNLMNTFRTDRTRTEAWLENSGIPLKARGEELSMEEYAALTENMPEI